MAHQIKLFSLHIGRESSCFPIWQIISLLSKAQTAGEGIEIVGFIV